MPEQDSGSATFNQLQHRREAAEVGLHDPAPNGVADFTEATQFDCVRGVASAFGHDLTLRVLSRRVSAKKQDAIRWGPERRSERLKWRAADVASVAFNWRGRRRETVRRYAFELLRRATPLVGVERDGLMYVTRTDDRVLGQALYQFGHFEEDVMAHTLDLLGSVVGRPRPLADRVFVDVGANIGTTVVPALLHFGARQGIAIEPDPTNLATLRSNLALNELTDAVRVLPVAISDAQGTVVLERSSVNSGDHRVRVDSAPPAEARSKSIEVEALTLDAALGRCEIVPADVGLIWIDTQGFEGHVLAGAKDTLDAGVPVAMEFWPAGLRANGTFDTVVALLEDRFSTIIDVRKGAKPLTDADSLHELAVDLGPIHTDLLLVP
ncbi:MAG: FkbM family methyltransferase [Actinobacteria bacterium]|nr:FkbM family methyltransferase [Actinomycetota bacterium]